jgi:hypothetical protein
LIVAIVRRASRIASAAALRSPETRVRGWLRAWMEPFMELSRRERRGVLVRFEGQGPDECILG